MISNFNLIADTLCYESDSNETCNDSNDYYDTSDDSSFDYSDEDSEYTDPCNENQLIKQSISDKYFAVLGLSKSMNYGSKNSMSSQSDSSSTIFSKTLSFNLNDSARYDASNGSSEFSSDFSTDYDSDYYTRIDAMSINAMRFNRLVSDYYYGSDADSGFAGYSDSDSSHHSDNSDDSDDLSDHDAISDFSDDSDNNIRNVRNFAQPYTYNVWRLFASNMAATVTHVNIDQVITRSNDNTSMFIHTNQFVDIDNADESLAAYINQFADIESEFVCELKNYNRIKAKYSQIFVLSKFKNPAVDQFADFDNANNSIAAYVDELANSESPFVYENQNFKGVKTNHLQLTPDSVSVNQKVECNSAADFFDIHTNQLNQSVKSNSPTFLNVYQSIDSGNNFFSPRYSNLNPEAVTSDPENSSTESAEQNHRPSTQQVHPYSFFNNRTDIETQNLIPDNPHQDSEPEFDIDDFVSSPSYFSIVPHPQCQNFDPSESESESERILTVRNFSPLDYETSSSSELEAEDQLEKFPSFEPENSEYSDIQENLYDIHRQHSNPNQRSRFHSLFERLRTQGTDRYTEQDLITSVNEFEVNGDDCIDDYSTDSSDSFMRTRILNVQREEIIDRAERDIYPREGYYPTLSSNNIDESGLHFDTQCEPWEGVYFNPR